MPRITQGIPGAAQEIRSVKAAEAPSTGRVSGMAARFETLGQAHPATPLTARTTTASGTTSKVSERVQQAAREIGLATAEKEARFEALLGNFADQLANPGFRLGHIKGGELQELLALDVQIPPRPGEEGVRTILSFFRDPMQITASNLQQLPALGDVERFAALLAIIRAGSLEKDNAAITQLADNFVAVLDSAMKAGRTDAEILETVGQIQKRANTPAMEAFITNYVLPRM